MGAQCKFSEKAPINLSCLLVLHSLSHQNSSGNKSMAEVVRLREDEARKKLTAMTRRWTILGMEKISSVYDGKWKKVGWLVGWWLARQSRDPLEKKSKPVNVSWFPFGAFTFLQMHWIIDHFHVSGQFLQNSTFSTGFNASINQYLYAY